MSELALAAGGTSAPVLDEAAQTRLVTLDFGVSLEGTLAGLEPPEEEREVRWAAGKVQPAGSMLSFDGASAVRISDSASAGPLYLPQTFTIECWISPASTTLDEQYVVGGLIAFAPVRAPVPERREQTADGAAQRV